MVIPQVFNCHLICYDDFGPDELCVSVKCGHVMHYKCMNEWISKQNTCPYCSISTTINDIIKIHYDDTINDFFSGYYKGKYEDICKRVEEEKIKEQVSTKKYPETSKNIIDNLNFNEIRRRNKRLEILLYYKIANESNFINQRGLEDMIQMEIAAKTEKINFLKNKLLQEKENSTPRLKNILYQTKVGELENKIKYQKEEKNRCLQKMAHLQLQYNKLHSENITLQERCLTLDACHKLKNKIASQTETINNLTKKNESLKRQKQNHKNIIDKINEKANQKYRDLYIKYQDLKLNSESLENKSELFEKKEREFYSFHRNMVILANKLVPIDNRTDESLRLFMKEKTNLNSDLWKKISDPIFNMYKHLTKIMEMDMFMIQNVIKKHNELSQESIKKQ